MRTEKKRLVKAAATVMAFAMICTSVPAPVSGAKQVEKPRLSLDGITDMVGTKVKLKVKKNGNKIKSTTWKSLNKKVATVSKKGLVTLVGPGETYVKAIVKVKKGKKYTLKCWVNSIDTGSIVGGWTTCDAPGAIDDVKGMIEKEFNDPNGGTTIEPVAILATQLVAGYNYRVLVRKTVTSPKPQTTYAIAEIYVDIQGNSSPLDVNLEGGIFDSGIVSAPKEATIGGWAQAEDVSIDDQTRQSVTALFSGLKNWTYKPVAVIETQASANNIRLICEAESKVSDPGGAPAYDIVEVHIDPATKEATLSGSYHFSDGGMIDDAVK